MKRLPWILMFAAFLLASPCFGAISHVQRASRSDVSGTSYTSFTATFSSATTTGNAIILGVTFGNVNPTITVTDSQSNAYTQAIKTYDAGHNQGVAIFYATNITGGASNTVTVSFSSSVAYLALGIHEYSGVAASAALDVTAGTTGNGTTPSSGSATTTAAGDLIFGAVAEDSAGSGDTFTAGSGYTKRVDLGSAAAYADEDQVQTSAGSIATTWTLSPSGLGWIADMASFQASTGGGGSPSITSLSPTSGAVGTSVTINGTNFGATQGSSTVKFNGTTATPTSWSATSIVAPVPSGAATGNVVVTVSGVASNGVSFTVVPGPSITSLSPTSGPVGQSVTITGTNFGATQGTSTVSFNGTTASVTSWSATSITVTVPSGATTGNVVVTVSGNASNGVSFTVVPAPSITSVSPTSGGAGTSVTITGTNFGATQGSSTVSFNGTTVGVLASDNFNRANANPIGTPWAAATGSIQLLSNAIAPSSVTPKFNSILYNGIVWPKDQSSQATLSQLRQNSGYPALVLRSDNTAQNFYYIDLDASPGFGGIGLPTPLNLQKVIGGVLQPPEYHGFGYITPQLNDTFRAQIIGATISVFQNGALVGSFTDPSPIASGSPGLFLQPDSSTGSVTDLAWGNFVGATGTTTSWSDTSIVVPVPSGATTGNVVVTVSGVASNGVPFTVYPTPSITSLSPTSGAVGTSVTVTGTNFGATQGTSTVTFNGTTATPTSWSATSIVAPVPSGAATGNVVVTVSGVASNGVSFTVLTTPNITSLSPTSGAVGASVTITGTNFGTTQGSSTVTFNGTTATPTSWSATSIVASVPSGAATGNVVVTVSGVASNGVSFTIVPGPSITSLSPTSGPVGQSVTITGTNFGATQGSSTVKFNGTAATPTSWSATSIAAPVPSAATTGNVVVHASGVDSNGSAFTVLPTPSITSLSPTSGAVGTSVTITGTNFGATQGTSTVTFNGTTATPTSWSATSIVAPVPSGATTGNVVVTVSSVASNGVNFTVQAAAPSITSLSPNLGPTGSLVQITGANFGSTQGSSTVKFNGTAGTVWSWSATSVFVIVPSGANSGPVLVTVGGLASNSVSFTVSGAPIICTP